MKKVGKMRAISSVAIAFMLMMAIIGCSSTSSKTDEKSSSPNDTSTSAAETPETSKSLTFVSWGGTTQDAQMKYWAAPFEKETGIKVMSDGPTDYGKFKAMVESNDVKWDVVDVEGDFAYKAAKDGLLEPLDFTVIDKTHLDPDFVFNYGVGSFIYSFVNAYNTTKVSGEPKGWGDFFDLKKFPGDRTVYKWPTVGVFEMALLADGVAPDHLYPLDIDRAFKKLDTLKPSINWWSTGAQSQQLLASGEASMGYAWNGRMYALIKDNAAINIDWTQNIKTGDYLVIPKGSKNKEAAMKFIAHALSAKPQADFANETSYGPVNADANSMLNPELVDYLPYWHKDSQVVLDVNFWAENEDAIIERWNAWLLK